MISLTSYSNYYTATGTASSAWSNVYDTYADSWTQLYGGTSSVSTGYHGPVVHRSSNCTPREALLRAADQIEKHPQSFDFMSPQYCGLGWVGHMAGVGMYQEAAHWLKTDTSTFYKEMERLTNGKSLLSGEGWYSKPALAAQGLRAYADKYFPAPRAGAEIVKEMLAPLVQEPTEEIENEAETA